MKRLLVLLGCLLAVSASAVLAQTFTQTSINLNQTYAVPGQNVTASYAIFITSFTNILNFTMSDPNNDIPQGIATNMSRADHRCCIYVINDNSGTRGIQEFNATGTNTRNITMPALIDAPVSLWTNASGAPANDFWVLDDTDNFLYHINSTGGFGSDPTGNFSISMGSNVLRSAQGNVTNARPTGFLVENSTGVVRLHNGSGADNGNITTFTGGGGSALSFWTNVSGNAPSWYVLTSAPTGGNLKIHDSTGAYADEISYDESVGFADYVTGMVSGSTLLEILVVNQDADRIYRLSLRNVTIAGSGTNISGTLAITTNVTTLSYPVGFPANASANFSFTVPSSYCGVSPSIIFRLNATNGQIATLATNTSFVMPFMSTSTGFTTLFNRTSLICNSTTNFTQSFSGSGVVNMTWRMPYFVRSTFQECNYKVNGSAMVNITNGTECVLTITNFAGNSSIALVIDESTAISGVTPSNVPAALAGASLAIIVVYVVTRRRKAL